MEEYRKKWGRISEASEEGLGSKWAVVPMIVVVLLLCTVVHTSVLLLCTVVHTRNIYI